MQSVNKVKYNHRALQLCSELIGIKCFVHDCQSPAHSQLCGYQLISGYQRLRLHCKKSDQDHIWQWPESGWNRSGWKWFILKTDLSQIWAKIIRFGLCFSFFRPKVSVFRLQQQQQYTDFYILLLSVENTCQVSQTSENNSLPAVVLQWFSTVLMLHGTLWSISGTNILTLCFKPSINTQRCLSLHGVCEQFTAGGDG